MNYAYSFETKWSIAAPLQQVWGVLYNQQHWPSWWKGVEKVTILQEGDANDIGKRLQYTWKSILPYRLTFEMESTFIDEYNIMEGAATGELVGYGVWRFTEKNGITHIQYNWDVNTTKKWMNFCAPFLKPFFTWNHNIVMKWGAKGLAKKLDATLIKY
jgi:hypothetical protein